MYDNLSKTTETYDFSSLNMFSPDIEQTFWPLVTSGVFVLYAAKLHILRHRLTWPGAGLTLAAKYYKNLVRMASLLRIFSSGVGFGCARPSLAKVCAESCIDYLHAVAEAGAGADIMMSLSLVIFTSDFHFTFKDSRWPNTCSCLLI